VAQGAGPRRARLTGTVASMADRLEHLGANVEWWSARREEQVALAQRAWSEAEPTWGIFGIPESEVGLLPPRLEGKATVELGCGTAYVSAWLARRGARPVAVDPTPTQLEIARGQQAATGISFPLIRAAGEHVPLRTGAFDFVISEYGAAIWADPYVWIPEAARLLRPGGELVFLGNSSLLMLCAPDEDDVPASDRLLRDHFGMHRFEWPSDPTVEFHLGHADWIRLLRANGFIIEELIELRPQPDTPTSYGFVTSEWARRWPAEEAWRARRE
jgi:SAM-dependent methyltransferase